VASPNRIRRPLLLLACALLTLTACARYLDMDEVESELEQEVAQRSDGLNVDVDCPDDIEVKQGDRFECDVSRENGDEAVVRVFQEDDEGNVRWEFVEVLNTDDVESRLEDRVAERVDGLELEVDCPDMLKARKGVTFDCTATAHDGSRATIEVVQEDGDGNVRWEITKLLDEGQ
jgi:hypothetical protein